MFCFALQLKADVAALEDSKRQLQEVIAGEASRGAELHDQVMTLGQALKSKTEEVAVLTAQLHTFQRQLKDLQVRWVPTLILKKHWLYDL